MGVSNFGFSLNGTISPAKYTFFDFNIGLGFAKFSFNGNINFSGFVPFSIGGWYGGLGLGGGVYDSSDSINGFFAFNAITGVLLFNWLNISVTLQMEIVPEFNFRFKPLVGYIYRFNQKQNSTNSSTDNDSTVSIARPSLGNYTVENVVGIVKRQSGGRWVNIMVGDHLTDDTVVFIENNSSISLFSFDGRKISTLKSGRGLLKIMF